MRKFGHLKWRQNSLVSNFNTILIALRASIESFSVSVRRAFCACLLLAFSIFVGNAYAQKGFIGSGLDKGGAFQALQRVQGRWVSQCIPSDEHVSSSYKIDRLTATYTHFLFVRVLYKDAACKVERARWPAKYRFVVQAGMQLRGGEFVYPLDLVEEEDPASAWSLYIRNILFQKAGKLYFGIPPWGEDAPSDRLSVIDYKYEFVRH